jgi:purine-binding chemotaxis protein CheW
MAERSGAGSQTGSKRSASASQQSAGAFQSNVCTFWLGDRCFALDVGLVGEVVSVDAIVAVPLAQAEVRGLFNLRGTPVPLIDLASLIDSRAPSALDKPGVALVVRSDDMTVGLSVDRLDGVVSAGRGSFVPSDDAEEHPVVQGFLELPGEGHPVVTILEPRALLERLTAMKYVQLNED